jgi:hypothetical protein
VLVYKPLTLLKKKASFRFRQVDLEIRLYIID